jgi:hypothetical protein
LGGSLAAALTLSLSAQARADSVVVRIEERGSEVADVRSERAVVALRDGHESLSVAVTLADSLADGRNRPLLWIVPVPGTPSDAKAEPIFAFPVVRGEDAGGWARDGLRSAFALMLATQIWPAPAALTAIAPRHVLVPYDADPASRLAARGVSVTVVDGESLAAIRAHALGLGVELPDPAARWLERSTRAAGAFVACFVRDPAVAWPGGDRASEFPELGVRVSFPAAVAEVPLVAGGPSARDALAVSVTTAGFTTATGASPYGVRATYLVRASSSADAAVTYGASGASGERGEPGPRATRFEWAAPPSREAAKLTFEPGSPGLVALVASMLERSIGRPVVGVVALLLFGILSAASSLIALPILPRADRPPAKAAAALGLLNLATVIAPLVVLLLRARRLGTSRARAAGFVALSSVVFVMLTGAAMFVIRQIAG